jgi:NADPH-dependent curcumin reductase CurA
MFLTGVVACGMISQYNSPPSEWYGVKTLQFVVSKRLKMQGFITSDVNFGPKYLKERDEKLSKVRNHCSQSHMNKLTDGFLQWLVEGSIQSREHITEGIDNAASAFVAMLKGDKVGKAILKVTDPDA